MTDSGRAFSLLMGALMAGAATYSSSQHEFKVAAIFVVIAVIQLGLALMPEGSK